MLKLYLIILLGSLIVIQPCNGFQREFSPYKDEEVLPLVHKVSIEGNRSPPSKLKYTKSYKKRKVLILPFRRMGGGTKIVSFGVCSLTLVQ